METKMNSYQKTLIFREQCILFEAEEANSGLNGWIGGNIPEYLSNDVLFCEKHKNDYYFYFTIVNPFDKQKMLSVFPPKNYDKLCENHIYPNCSILLFEHEISTESSNIDFTNLEIVRHDISKGTTITDPVIKENPYFIKLGGKPDLIQGSSHYFKKLDENSLSFFFQINEEGYPESLLKGSYPFFFGALYIYAKINESFITEPCVGYWQFA